MLSHFAEDKSPVKVFPASSELIDGEWIKGNAASVDAEMISLPITPAQIKNMPEGAYTTEDRKFYSDESVKYPQNSIIVWNNIKYKIRDISDRSAEGGFIIYFAKREVKQ